MLADSRQHNIPLTILFTILLCPAFGQKFSLRIDTAHPPNLASHFALINDTFYIPAIFYETFTPAVTFGTSLVQVKSDGTVLPIKKYRLKGVSLQQGNGLVKLGQKYYSTSNSNDTITNNQRMSFYVFNSTSDTVLIKLFGDTANDSYGCSIQKNLKTKNQLIVFGMSDTTCGGHSGNYKRIIWVLDTLGNLISKKILPSSCIYRTVYNSDTTKNKGYIFSGFEDTSPPYGPNYVIKLDSNLNTVWTNYYDTANSVTPAILTLKSGKHILAYGRLDSSHSYNTFWSRITLLKLDENGNQLWKKQYGNLTLASTATNVKELPNGDLIVCGVMGSNNFNYNGLLSFLMRTDSVGNLKWLNTYRATYPLDTVGQNYLYDVLPMSDGGFASVGFVSPNDGSGQDTWLLRVDSTGCLIAGCNTTQVEIFSVQSLAFNIYPNPTSGQFFIEANTTDKLTVDLFGVNGRHVFSANVSDKENIDITTLDNGAYTLTIKTADRIINKKLVILR